MRSSVRHMLHRQLSQGWGGWREMLTIRAAALAALRRSVMSLKHRKQRLGLSTWRDAAREAKGEATREDKMRRAVMRIKHRGLARGLEGWVATWKEGRRKMQAMRQGAGRFLHHELSKW